MVGLVLGMLSTLLILEYVLYERSYDHFRKNTDNLYRVVYDRYGKEGLMWKTTNFYVPAGPYLKQTFPEVEEYANLFRKYNITINQTDHAGNPMNYVEDKCYYATSSMFDVLTVPLIAGDRQGLDKPNTVVISERAKKKYFGNADPIGQIMTVNHKEKYTVTGVFRTIPANSHLRSDLFFSMETLYQRRPGMLNDWVGDGALLYLILKPGTDYKAFEAKAFPRMISENYADYLERSHQRDVIYLQPVRDIHLESFIEYELEPPGNGKAVAILFGFSIFFLLIAWINYANLSSARAVERAKEIGIKKVNGSSRGMLMKQFIAEAFSFNLICYLLTFGLFLIVDPYFRMLTGIDAGVVVFGSHFWLIFSLSVFAGAALSSVYPALVLVAYRPVLVLKGRFATSNRGFFFRKGLVTFQFVISILLLSGTIIGYKQVRFLMQKDMGVDCHSKMVIKTPRAYGDRDQFNQRVEAFRDKLLQIPGVDQYTYCSDIPGDEVQGFWGGYKKGSKADELLWYFAVQTDPYFLDVFKPKLLAGRFFREDDKPEMNYIILNETGVKRLGYQDPQAAINQRAINHAQKECTIIGVFEDFHFRSIKVDAVATCYTNNNWRKSYLILDTSNFGNVSVNQLVDKSQTIFQEFFPGDPFDYSFLDDHLAADLATDRTFVAVFSIFSILAIVISLIGIIGLLLITVGQNIRDFGMRKVLGAEVVNISMLLTRQFSWQFVLATSIALPVAFWGFNKWIRESYSYHIDLKIIYLIVPVLVILLVFLIVMFLIANRTYRTNTIEVLNME